LLRGALALSSNDALTFSWWLPSRGFCFVKAQAPKSDCPVMNVRGSLRALRLFWTGSL
jgi:hypothetical protein